MTIEKSAEKPSISRTRVVLSQVVACLALDCLLIGLGMSISFVTMVVPEVMDAKVGISLTKKQASWFGSMAYLCQPLGSLCSGPLLDHFGRKRALFLVNIPHVAAWLLMHYAWDAPSLFAANALLGIGTGIMEAPSVTYVGEICDPSMRGILTTMTNSFTSTGMFLAYLLGAVLPWRQAALASLAAPLATMLLVLFVPETPIWLLSKGRQKEALHSLCWLRGWTEPEDVKKEFEQLVQYSDVVHQCVICVKEGKANVHPCEHSQANIVTRITMKLKHILLVKETMRPFVLVMAYFLFHTMSGLIPIRPNMVNFCRAMGMKYDSKNIVVAIGVIFIIMNLLSSVLVKLFGKRKLVVGSMLATAVCSLSVSLHAHAHLTPAVFSYDSKTFPAEKDLLPVVLFIMLVCFTSLGIPWVLLSEMFPFRSRGIATGIAAALSYVFIFLASKTNYNLEASARLDGAFAVYAAFGFAGALYLYFCLPETERKTLVEIEAYYRGEQRIFADDFFINFFRKKRSLRNEANKPMLVN